MTQVPVDFVSLFTVIKTPVNVSEVQAGLDEVAANIPGWTDRRCGRLVDSHAPVGTRCAYPRIDPALSDHRDNSVNSRTLTVDNLKAIVVAILPEPYQRPEWCNYWSGCYTTWVLWPIHRPGPDIL